MGFDNEYIAREFSRLRRESSRLPEDIRDTVAGPYGDLVKCGVLRILGYERRPSAFELQSTAGTEGVMEEVNYAADIMAGIIEKSYPSKAIDLGDPEAFPDMTGHDMGELAAVNEFLGNPRRRTTD